MRVGIVLVATILLSGCVDELGPSATHETNMSLARPTVVALIDTGINPYHIAFRSGPAPDAAAWADAFGATVLPLSANGTFEERWAADQTRFNESLTGGLYAFPGTRVLAASFSHVPDEPPLMDRQGTTGHGTGTASLVAREDPSALIVMLQVDQTFCALSAVLERCPQYPPLTDALDWAASQSWIDVISISMNVPANAYLPGEASPEIDGYLAASRAAVESGKLLVTSAGNYPTLAVAGYTCGPPWIVTIGGFEPASQGEQVESSKGVDFIANYTDDVAVRSSLDETATSSGTSFGTPIVAGVAARVLSEARVLDPSMPSGQGARLRAALNATAWTPEATAWQPAISPGAVTSFQLAVPIVLGTQSGWGVVDGSVVAHALEAFLLEQDAPPREDMRVQQALRERVWSEG